MKTLKYKAIISYHENGQKCTEEWLLNNLFINNKLHKEDGPAIQFWYDNGLKYSEFYYLNGVELTEQEFKLKTDPEYQKYIELKLKFEGTQK